MPRFNLHKNKYVVFTMFQKYVVCQQKSRLGWCKVLITFATIKNLISIFTCSRKWLKYFISFPHHRHVSPFLPKTALQNYITIQMSMESKWLFKKFWTNTYTQTRIKKLNPCMATFLTWYPIAKLFSWIRIFLICHNNNFGTYCIDVRVVTCFDTDLWLGHSRFSYLAIVQTHAYEVSSQMICKIFLHGFIQYVSKRSISTDIKT